MAENYTQFEGLNVDTKLLILEELDFVSLMTMAEMNQEMRALVVDVYRRKLAAKQIRIIQSVSGMMVLDEGDLISIDNLNFTTKFLQTYGQFVRNISFNYYNAWNEMHGVMDLVIRHCDSLTNFNLRSFSENAFSIVEKPFPKVEYVSIDGNVSKLFSNTLQFNELFPKMRSLILEQSRMVDRKSLLRNFPNLEHLHLSSWDPLSEDELKLFIELNPQIRSLAGFHAPTSFLEFLNDNLPNLDTLDFTLIDGATLSNKIHFHKVTSLRVASSSNNFPTNVKFDQVKELTVDWYFLNPSMWKNFIWRHNTVNKLKLGHAQAKLTDDMIADIGDLPNLQEAFVAIDDRVKTATLVEFMQKNNKLAKLTVMPGFSCFPATVEQMNLRQEIPKEWTLTPLNQVFVITRMV